VFSTDDIEFGVLRLKKNGGHLPVPLIQNGSTSWNFFTFFWVPNFQGRFDSLNECFLVRKCLEYVPKGSVGHLKKCVLLG
jgi:hypothetical protein